MKHLLLLLSLCLFLQNISANTTNYEEEDITVIFPEDFTNGWENYIGKTVVFTQKLYLCGQYWNDFFLSHERLMSPGETATYGSDEYNTLVNRNKTLLITASASGLDESARLGSYIENVRARITGVQQMDILNSYELYWKDNKQLTQRPDLGDASLIVCATNLENFYTTLGGYGASNAAQYQRQLNKIINALSNIDADIYGIAEVEEGAQAITALVNGLNSQNPDRYAYVDDNNTTASTYTKVGYIYRTDKVEPVLDLGHPYTSGAYNKRMYVQAFDEKETGERFILSMNHFKAQSTSSTGEETTGNIRLGNATTLTNFLNRKLKDNYYYDPDVLIMGDFNSYTKDKPILHIINEGYIDELAKYDPNTYSHVYMYEAGVLDHVFTSESMSAQVTGAAVYHINCDEYYRYSYKYDNYGNTMYGYSDHDPVVVGLKLHSEPIVYEEINFSETFEKSLGGFKAVNIKGTGSWIWEGFAKMNGYKNGENEDWLISPPFNLEEMKTATLKFDHLINFTNSAQMPMENTLWISTEYTGGTPVTDTWTQISIPVYPAGKDWKFVTNDNINIPNKFLKDNFRFAFKYTCPENRASLWEIKNLEFKASKSESEISRNSFMPIHQIKTDGMHIIIENAEDADISIFDIIGQCTSTQESRITVPASGIYIVRINNEIHKIVIK